MARKVDDLQPIYQEPDAEDARNDEVLIAACLGSALKNGETLELAHLLVASGRAKNIQAAREALVPLTEQYED